MKAPNLLCVANASGHIVATFRWDAGSNPVTLGLAQAWLLNKINLDDGPVDASVIVSRLIAIAPDPVWGRLVLVPFSRTYEDLQADRVLLLTAQAGVGRAAFGRTTEFEQVRAQGGPVVESVSQARQRAKAAERALTAAVWMELKRMYPKLTSIEVDLDQDEMMFVRGWWLLEGDERILFVPFNADPGMALDEIEIQEVDYEFENPDSLPQLLVAAATRLGAHGAGDPLSDDDAKQLLTKLSDYLEDLTSIERPDQQLAQQEPFLWIAPS